MGNSHSISETRRRIFAWCYCPQLMSDPTPVWSFQTDFRYDVYVKFICSYKYLIVNSPCTPGRVHLASTGVFVW